MPLAPGTRLGPYEIVAALGAGGMGEVHRARDTRLQRDVAVKVLPHTLALDPLAFGRLEREARTASALNHPNIVSVFDTGRHESGPYVVMELVEGRTLRELLDAGPLPLRKALQISVQIAEGMAAAHAAGIVHRDLKPENVIVKRDGLAKILDFGIAKLAPPVGGQQQLSTETYEATAPGVIVGTIGYMSPEQASGEAIDFRSDQFSFGSMLYEMVAGRRPFERATAAQTLAAIIQDEPPPLGELNPQAPVPVRWIVERCLAKDPGDRYGASRDLALDLKTVERHLSDRGTGATEIAATPMRRRGRAWQAVAWLVAGALFGAAAAAWIFRAAPVEPPSIRPLTFSGLDSSPSVSSDGRAVVFQSARDGLPRIWIKQLEGGAEVPLTEGPDYLPHFSPDGTSILFLRSTHRTGTTLQMRGSASLYRIAAVGGEPRKIGDDVVDADWSPDGRQVAVLRYRAGQGLNDSVVTIEDENGTRRELAVLKGQSVQGIRWSPDGRHVSVTQATFGVVGPSRITLIATADGKTRDIFPPSSGGQIAAATWLDGDTVVYAQAEGMTTVAVPGSGATRLIRQPIDGAGQILYWTPSRIDAVAIAGPGRLIIDSYQVRQNLWETAWPVAGAAAVPGVSTWVTRGATVDRQPAYSPDGQRIVFTSNRSGNLDLWVASTKTRTVTRLTDDPGADWDAAFVASPPALLWSSNRSGHLEVWTARPDGSGAVQLSHDGSDAENPSASPDGEWMVYLSASPDHAGLWKQRAAGGPATKLASGTFGWPEFSPDGQYILITALLANRPEVQVLRLADGSLLPFRVGVPNGGSGRARWTRDGRRILLVGNDERGRAGLFVADFSPATEAPAARPFLFPEIEGRVESFGVSPDGSRLTIAAVEDLWTLQTIDGLPGIALRARK